MADNWILESIKPKSDQLNADDLIAGPIDVTIEDVKRGSDDKQPVAIVIGEGRQPYKPCKSMRRVLVHLWGDQPKKWVGNRLRLYCDSDVMFGGLRVGGIRISHASIDSKTELMITQTRGKRVAVTIEPMPNADKKPDIATRVAKAIEAIGKATSADLIDKYQVTIETELLDKCTVEQRTALKDAVADALARLQET